MTSESSTIERTRQALARIESDNDRVSIFISIDSERSIAAARASDKRKNNDESLGSMDGKLVAIKDNLAVSGLPWTAGIGAYRNRIASEDSGTVARLKAAGAIIVGTVNLHEGALGATTDNAHFGTCMNPLRDGFTPGGSSGGSGAAVAGGYVDMAVGSDTMGSVRIPAAYCGIAGLKPTDGRVGRSGIAYLSPTLDTVGPLARTVRELRQALEAMAGRDADPRSMDAPVSGGQRDNSMASAALAAKRIGIPHQLSDVECEEAVLEGFEIARRSLENAGAAVTDIDLENWDPGSARRGGLMLSEAEGAVVMADLLDPEVSSVGTEFRKMLQYGADLSSARLVGALDRIARARTACLRAFNDVDFLLLPTAPQRAFAHGSEVPANQADLTALANFAGCPAVALPVGLGSGELPASVQLIGAPWQDFPLLAATEALEAALTQ